MKFKKPKTAQMSMRLPETTVDTLFKIAVKKGISIPMLCRIYINEKINEELEESKKDAECNM